MLQIFHSTLCPRQASAPLYLSQPGQWSHLSASSLQPLVPSPLQPTGSWSHHHLIPSPPCPTNRSGNPAKGKHQPETPILWTQTAGDTVDLMAFHGIFGQTHPLHGVKLQPINQQMSLIFLVGGSCILVLASCLHLLWERCLEDVLFSRNIHIWAFNVHNPTQTSILIIES